MANHVLLEHRLEQSGHRIANIIQQFINHAVQADLHALALGGRAGARFLRDMKTDNNGIGRARQQHVVFVDAAHARERDLEGNLFALDIAQRLLNGLQRPLDIRFHDDREFLDHLSALRLEQVFERSTARRGNSIQPSFFHALRRHLARSLVVRVNLEFGARLRHGIEAKAFDGVRRARRPHLDAYIIDQCLHASPARTTHNRVPDLKRTRLNQQVGRGSHARLQARFDHKTCRATARIGLQLEHFGLQQNHFQQIVNTLSRSSADGATNQIAAPIFRGQSFLLQLAFHAIHVGRPQVNLVDRNHHAHFRGLRMLNRFAGLRHDAVVGGDNNDSDIRQVRATGAHRGECRMARRVEKSDGVVVIGDHVRADVLGDTAIFALRDAGPPNMIQQRCLTMVNMTHERDDRRTLKFVFLPILRRCRLHILRLRGRWGRRRGFDMLDGK